MNAEAKLENGIVVVTVSGSVDALTAGDLYNLIAAQLAKGDVNVVIDLTQIEFMSSAGLRTLLSATKEARSNGGDLRVASTKPGIDKILAMSGFTSIAKVFSSAQDAAASFVAQA